MREIMVGGPFGWEIAVGSGEIRFRIVRGRFCLSDRK